MSLNAISLNKLLILQEVLSSGSVSSAARRLHRSQPTVSSALSDLRAFYGDPLLVRDGTGLVPTRFATSLLEGLADWRLRGDALLAMRANFEPGETSRHFVVRASDYHLTAFGTTLRDIAVQTGRTVTFAFVRPVGALDVDYQAMGFDFAFQVNKRVRGSFETCEILSEPYRVLFDPAYRAAPEDLDAFCAATFVLASPAGSGPSAIDAKLAEIGRHREVGFRVPSVSDAARFVAGTNFLSVLPASTAVAAGQSLGLATAPLKLDVPAVTSHLVWPKARATDPAVRWLSACLTADGAVSPPGPDSDAAGRFHRPGSR
ncbi:MAG: LysR family transcriptional regulator [Salinarimonas sp.]